MEIVNRTEVAHFDKTSAAYRKEYEQNTPDGYSFRIRREKVLSLLEDGHGKSILDLASGPGTMIKGLRALGYRVACVDAAPGMIELAKKEAESDPEVTCEVGDAYALRFPPASFDAVTAMGLIEYIRDESRYLTEMQRILKSGGVFIVTYPNLWSPWRLWNKLLRALIRPFRSIKDDPLLHREYTRKRATELLQKNGFTVERALYYNVKLIPFPFDRLFPVFTVHATRALEWLANTSLEWLGTGFILEARKR